MNDVQILLSRLDYTHPALVDVRARIEAGDEAGALRAVVDHYRTRTSPTYLFDEEDIAAFDDEEVIREADQICEHFLYGYDLGPVIDWHYNPTIDSSRDPEWMWSLARHNYWATLARAYALTGNEVYAREFVRQMMQFNASWPMAEHIRTWTFPAMRGARSKPASASTRSGCRSWPTCAARPPGTRRDGSRFSTRCTTTASSCAPTTATTPTPATG
jgi:hypothetical protein